MGPNPLGQTPLDHNPHHALIVLETLKTRDWKTRDLNSMESVTIFKSKSDGAEIKTVYGGIVVMSKASVHQGMTASAVALRDEITLLINSE